MPSLFTRTTDPLSSPPRFPPPTQPSIITPIPSLSGSLPSTPPETSSDPHSDTSPVPSTPLNSTLATTPAPPACTNSVVVTETKKARASNQQSDSAVIQGTLPTSSEATAEQTVQAGANEEGSAHVITPETTAGNAAQASADAEGTSQPTTTETREPCTPIVNDNPTNDAESGTSAGTMVKKSQRGTSTPSRPSIARKSKATAARRITENLRPSPGPSTVPSHGSSPNSHPRPRAVRARSREHNINDASREEERQPGGGEGEHDTNGTATQPTTAENDDLAPAQVCNDGEGQRAPNATTTQATNIEPGEQASAHQVTNATTTQGTNIEPGEQASAQCVTTSNAATKESDPLLADEVGGRLSESNRIRTAAQRDVEVTRARTAQHHPLPQTTAQNQHNSMADESGANASGTGAGQPPSESTNNTTPATTPATVPAGTATAQGTTTTTTPAVTTTTTGQPATTTTTPALATTTTGQAATTTPAQAPATTPAQTQDTNTAPGSQLVGPGAAAQQWPELRDTTGHWTNGGTHVRAADPRVDLTRVGAEHAWAELPVHELNMFHFVVNAGDQRRPDMQRWYDFYTRFGRVATQQLWSRFVHRAVWWRVPSTIPHVTRTFVRDEHEAVYVDRMARAIDELVPITTIRDVLLFNLRDGMLGRVWNGFHLRGEYLLEANYRVNHDLFAPHDSPEVRPREFQRLRELYPPVPAWFEPQYFPNHVPVPLPPVIFYFHTLFLTGTIQQRNWLYDVARYEFALLFMAMWWHDARRGGVGVVLPHETIDWLVDLLEDAPIDTDSFYGPGGRQTGAGYIAARMRDVANAGHFRRNNCRFPRFPWLDDSQLVWTREDGYPDNERPGGRQVYRDPRNLREYNVGFDRYGRRPRVGRREDRAAHAEQQRRRADETNRRSPSGYDHPRSTLGPRRREDEDPASPPPSNRKRQRQYPPEGHQEFYDEDDGRYAGARHEGRSDGAGPSNAHRNSHDDRQYNDGDGGYQRARDVPYQDRRYFHEQGTDEIDARPISPRQWGFRHEGPVETRDFRPISNVPDEQPAVNTHRMREIRERLHDIERQAGPYVPPRDNQKSGGRQPHGRLRGVPSQLFSSGRIPRRESKLRAEQRELMAELDELEQEEEDARRDGEFVPAPGDRNPEFSRWYSRRDDYDDGGNGHGGNGGGYNGGVGGGYGGGGMASAA